MSKTVFDDFGKLVRQEKFEEALSLTSSLVANDPNNSDYIGLHGLAKFYVKDISCLEELDKAVSLDPENPYRYSSRAYIRDIMGDTPAAIEDYLKTIELDPEDHIAFNNLGMLQEKVGRQENAKKSFDKADKLLGIDKQKPAFPEENLQHTINKKKREDKWTVMKSIVGSKSGWQEFLSFVKTKFQSK